MTRTASRPDQLEAEYLQRKSQIRADDTLRWEKKELAIKALGEEYHRARKEMEAA